jgi:hypothetical protein
LTLEELDNAVKHPVFIPPENLPAHREYLQSKIFTHAENDALSQ